MALVTTSRTSTLHLVGGYYLSAGKMGVEETFDGFVYFCLL